MANGATLIEARLVSLNLTSARVEEAVLTVEGVHFPAQGTELVLSTNLALHGTVRKALWEPLNQRVTVVLNNVPVPEHELDSVVKVMTREGWHF